MVTAALAITLYFKATVPGAALSPSPAHERNSSLSICGIDVNSNDAGSETFQTGGTISFGTFNNQPLKWKILKISDENKALVFAADVLPDTYLPFDETSNVWETSNIRSWLNGTQKGEFLSDNNFTQDDKNTITQTNISSGILGNATNDYVFLISKDEYYTYDIGNVAYDINSFWSRTGESDSENVALFASYHQASGSFDASEKGGIRPMMWVDIDSLLLEDDFNNEKSNLPQSYSDTISVAIQSTDNLVSSTLGRSYMVYGPFDGNKVESVTCQLNNEVEASLEIAISGQNKTVEGVEITNCIGFGKTYTDTLSISSRLLNVNQQFYLFIGSDNIKNLTGTISFSNQ